MSRQGHNDMPSPGRAPSFIRSRSSRAMASFENLVVLANYEERLRDARKIVWRDRGERPVELPDLWECVEHARKGGTRAGGLAFAIRVGINVILLLTRIRKVSKTQRLALIQNALFGPDCFRFAAMLGSFVALYKLILNTLPILIPEPNPQTGLTSPPKGYLSDTPPEAVTPGNENGEGVNPPRGRLSLQAQAHQLWVGKKTRRWYSILAGSVAGAVAIAFEKPGRRTTIAQQLFVRGLQGSYNSFSATSGFKIPHGDVLLFSICCGQILYSFLIRPETLPPSYTNWMSHACKANPPGVSINRDLVNAGFFKIEDIDALISRKDIAPGNLTELLERKRLAQLPIPHFGARAAPCAAVHPRIESCLHVQLERLPVVVKWVLPIYGALHIIPMILFRRNTFMRSPVRMFLRALFAALKSSTFLGVFVTIFQTWNCSKYNLYTYLTALRSSPSSSLLKTLALLIPQPLIDFLIKKPSFWIGGALAGLSLFVEDKHRREELAMYTLPKGLEGAWGVARDRGLVFGMGKWGDILLTSIGMGMVMSIYQNDPQHLSGFVRRILYQFVGPN